VRGIVETAKRQHRAYLKSKREEKPGEELIRAAIDLAQLDLVYRIGRLELNPIDGARVQDVTNMLALVHADDFTAKRTCVLNPTFGSASELVGGADGDMFIDGTLIDIKRTSISNSGETCSIRLSATIAWRASAESTAVAGR